MTNFKRGNPPPYSHAPWTNEEVTNLNESQRSGDLHPFTCGSGNRGDEAHRTATQEYNLPDAGTLIATPYGWICPAYGCDYRQNWAYKYITSGEWKRHTTARPPAQAPDPSGTTDRSHDSGTAGSG